MKSYPTAKDAKKNNSYGTEIGCANAATAANCAKIGSSPTSGGGEEITGAQPS